MAESLIELLPKIVAEGKKEVEKIFERLESNNKIIYCPKFRESKKMRDETRFRCKLS